MKEKVLRNGMKVYEECRQGCDAMLYTCPPWKI